jgi:hypothetical protein
MTFFDGNMSRHDQMYIDKLFPSCRPSFHILEITVTVEVLDEHFDDLHLAALSDGGIKELHKGSPKKTNGGKRDKRAHNKGCYRIDIFG